MKHTDEFLENRILWRAGINDLPSKNGLFFKDLNDSEKAIFEGVMQSSAIGIPVLLFLSKNRKWTLFGTRKLVTGSFKGKPSTFEYLVRRKQMKDINSDYEVIDYASIREFEFEHRLREKPLKPGTIKWRYIVSQEVRVFMSTENGNEVVMHGPKGNDLTTMTNVLLMLLRMYGVHK